MKKFFAVSALILTSSLALSFPPMKKLKDLIPSFMPNHTQTADGCLDFSGKWKGICEETSGETKRTLFSEMEISQNGCQQITIDGSTSDFNGDLTVTQMSPKYSITYSTDINWGPTQNTIYYHSQFKVRRLNGEDETHVGRGRSHKTIKISDETITTKENLALEYTHPNPGNQSTHTQCTYHKNI